MEISLRHPGLSPSKVAMVSNIVPPPVSTDSESATERSRTRAFYCRVQAGVLERQAEKATGSLKREYRDLAQQWLALERFHNAEAARASGTSRLLAALAEELELCEAAEKLADQPPGSAGFGPRE